MEQLPGPRGPVPYRRDAWGYPTVQVRSEQEHAFAIGWLHATDRLLQCELTRLVGEGRLLEVVGDKPFAARVDRAVRSLGLHLGLDDAAARLPPALRAWFEAYCQGFEVGAAGRGRPLALRLLGLPHRPWTPTSILLVYRVLAWFGLTSTTQLAKLLVAELASEGASPEALRVLLGEGAEGLDAAAIEALRWPGPDALLGVPDLGGSNAFAIAGSRTASGGAVLLSEFHLEIGHLPPVMYAVDVRYDDGRYALGFTAPGLPHLLGGRTRDVGFTYTFGHADNVDVTVERCEAGEVIRGDARIAPTRRVEVARVRGGADQRWTFYDLPDAGTVLGDPVEGGALPAVRWRGLEDAVSDHEVLHGVLSARSVDELVALHRRTRTLAAGAVFGDREGHIAWMHTGVVGAHRRGWGPRSVGDDAPLPEARRPVVVDPPEGFVAAANEGVPGWTAFPEPPYRKERLVALLSGGDGGWDEARAARVTRDPYDGCAARLLAVWAPLLPEVPEARAMITWGLHQEACDVDLRRVQRARFHALHHEACRALVARVLGLRVARLVLDELGQLLALQANLDDVLALEHPDLLDEHGLRDVLARAWARRASARAAVPGPLTFTDPVTEGRLPSFLGLQRGPIAVDGGPTSLFQLREMRFDGHRLLGGPAFHLVVDMGRDGGLYDVAGGASERWRGPGYGEGLDAWARGAMAPIGPRG